MCYNDLTNLFTKQRHNRFTWRNRMYLLLLAIIYLAFISLGLPDSLLGASWPTIHAELGIPISYMGIISMIISGGTIISSLFTANITKKFGTRAVTAASILLTSLALFGFSVSKEFYLLCIFAIPYGFGAGAIDAALNNYVASHYNSRHMSWLHCFWGVGAIISPYIMSFALTHASLGAGYRAVSYIQLAIFVAVLLSFPLWKINSKKADEEIEEKPIKLTEVVKIPGVPSILIGFMAYCAAEATSMLWASCYFEEVFNSSKDEAAALGSLFFIGITGGRFIAGFISERLGDAKMIRLGICWRRTDIHSPKGGRYCRICASGTRLGSHISLHHTLNTAKLRQGKIRKYHWNTNGISIRWRNLYASPLRCYLIKDLA